VRAREWIPMQHARQQAIELTTPRASRLRVGIFLLVGLLIPVVAGCRGGNRSELVESELRKKEAELLEARAEANRLEALNVALMREMQAARPGYSVEPAPEFPTPNSYSYSVKKIVLGRLTGGYDDDGWPGDEALEVALEPRDPDDHTIKAPGTLFVTALAIDPQGQKIPFSSWKVSPDELRRTWKSGLLGTGYHVILPWKGPPPSKKIRVVVRFALPDGRTLEADKDVTVRPPTELRSAPPPVIVPEGGPSFEEAPLPNPVGPEVEAQKPKNLWQRLVGTPAKNTRDPIAESKPVESRSTASGPKGNSFMDRFLGNVGKPPEWWKGDTPTTKPVADPLIEPDPLPARAPILPAQPLGRPSAITPLSRNASEGPELIRVSGEEPVSDDSIWKPAPR
ncbi:MAG: hypothetical protein AB7K24_25445, partial [Gemmataceae bacterium]